MKITLLLMVQNEEKTIRETLLAALPCADQVMIVDTGSTDDTVRVARTVLSEWLGAWNTLWSGAQDMFVAGEGIEGDTRRWSIVDRPWVDFSSNRNDCLDIVENEWGPDQWIVFLDADTRLQGVKELRTFLCARDGVNPAIDSYQLEAHLGDLTYPMHRVFRAGSPWRFYGRVHEVPVDAIEAAGPGCPALPGPVIPYVAVRYMGTDAGTERKHAAWERHLKFLYQDIDDEQGNNPRTYFYLAQTLHCLGRINEAKEIYIKRLRMPGNLAERWVARLRAYRLGHVTAPSGQDKVPHHIDLLVEERPWRAEGWLELAQWYGVEQGDWVKACAYAKMAATLEIPKHDQFMIETGVYTYGATLFYALCLYRLGEWLDAYELFSALLKVEGTDMSEPDALLVRQHLAIMRQEHGIEE